MTQKRKSTHYVKNDEFLAEMIKYREEYLKHEKDPDKFPRPRPSEYIGKAILSIATNLSSKGNFANYTYRDEMVSDAIENCFQYLKNFDPSKSSNPFAYFTQISHFAFIRRIQKEKRQAYTKVKLFENAKIDKYNIANYAGEEVLDAANPMAAAFNLTDRDMDFFDNQKPEVKSKKMTRSVKKPKKPKTKKALENFFQGETNG
jgi:hypothetical protein